MIRELKEKSEKISTKYKLLDKPYNFVDVLRKVLREYNFSSLNWAHKMTPIHASKSENEVAIQKHYQEKYDDYDPKNGFRFKVGDVIRN